MPGMNGTGPEGLGAMTGRGMGICRGTRAAGNPAYNRGMNYGRGMGCGRGMNYGRGMSCRRGMNYGRGAGCGRGMNYGRGADFCRWNAADERGMLENEREILKNRIAVIDERLGKD